MRCRTGGREQNKTGGPNQNSRSRGTPDQTKPPLPPRSHGETHGDRTGRGLGGGNRKLTLTFSIILHVSLNRLGERWWPVKITKIGGSSEPGVEGGGGAFSSMFVANGFAFHPIHLLSHRDYYTTRARSHSRMQTFIARVRSRDFPRRVASAAQSVVLASSKTVYSC